jgi:hypothetical protein
VLNLKLPDFMKGGQSEPQPHGTIRYKDQEVRSAATRLLLPIGRGRAIAEIKARQNWDKKGGIFSGDVQSTNGTSSVRDPEDNDQPAELRVDTTYCVQGFSSIVTEGKIKEETSPDGTTSTSLVEEKVKLVFDPEGLVVCDARLDAGDRYNNAAFHQDDTPSDFNGNFRSRVTGGAEATVKAAPCPTDELAQFQTPEFQEHLQDLIAEENGLEEAEVEVKSIDEIGKTDAETKKSLKNTLKRFARGVNSKGNKIKGLDIQYSANTETLSNSCYQSMGAVDIDDILETTEG